MRVLLTLALFASLGAVVPGCVNTAILASIEDGADRAGDASDDHETVQLEDALDPHDDDIDLDSTSGPSKDH